MKRCKEKYTDEERKAINELVAGKTGKGYKVIVDAR
jgi:hypothetical protein